jgi:hypothetical protein
MCCEAMRSVANKAWKRFPTRKSPTLHRQEETPEGRFALCPRNILGARPRRTFRHTSSP